MIRILIYFCSGFVLFYNHEIIRMKRKCINYFIGLLAAVSGHVRATETLRFEWISDRDGLSQNTVRCILQDRSGFIWLGTINGLNRYNGKEFLVAFSEKGGFVSLPDNRIRSMTEDRQGYIWIRTTADIFCCYDPRMERFVEYDEGNGQKNFSNIRVCRDGDVWLWGKSDGCCRVRHSGTQMQALHFGRQEAGVRSVYFVHEDASHGIWIGCDTGIFRMEGDRAVKISSEVFYAVNEADGHLYFINGQHILPFDPEEQKFGEPIAFAGRLALNMTTSLNDGLILIATKDSLVIFDSQHATFVPSETFFGQETVRNAYIYTDNKGNKWIYNHSGNIWRHLPDNRFEKINLIPQNIITTIDAERYEVYHDSRDVIWISTYGNGLFALDLNDGYTHHYTSSNSELPTNYLLCVIEDRSGEIWVGTEFAGISKISRNDYPFHILYPTTGKTGDRSNSVRLIYEDTQGRFWMGTRNGYLYVYDEAFRKIQSHKIENSVPFCITEDTAGNMWLGTRGNGLFVFPPSGRTPVRHYHLHTIARQNTTSDNVFDILQDTKNRIWVASFGGGLHYADLREPEITFQHINARTVNQDMVRVIMQDRTGLIWTGTNEGVNVFNPDELIRDSERYINFHFDAGNDRSLNNNEVKTIFEDSKGRLWFGTTGGGLNLLVREEPLENSWFKHYTAANGLSNELIQTILEDDDGYIWVSTEGGSGISRFNPETEQFESFSFSSGKQTALFNDASGWKTRSGELMFGSYSGVYIFDPSQMQYDSLTQPVIITGLKINGVDARPGQSSSPLTESITLTKSIRLKHHQNSFDVEFAMLHFRSPDFNRYAYYLDGYEEDWNPPGRHNIAIYRNVPAGTYVFKVRGCNSLGVWTNSETELLITIIPPFWKSQWAYMLYFVFCCFAVFFAVKIIMKFNKLNTDVKIERQLTEYKLRFFTNISHEFRTPLTIIRGSIETLMAIPDLPAAISRQTGQIAKSSSRLLRLIDQLLVFRQLQNKGLELNVERTDAVSFFYDIYRMFEEMAEKKKIEFLFKCDFPTKEVLLDRNKFDKIAYNLLSNAMKHTPECGVIRMKLTFSDTDDRMTLSVSDSGAGVPKEKRNSLFVRFAQIDHTSGGTGIGLHLTAELAAVHKGKVEYSDSKLGGACFSVSVPLSDANYNAHEIIETHPMLGHDNLLTETEQAQEALSLKKSSRYHKLLIIEDDDEVRDFIRTQLDTSFALCMAKNGIEGVEKAIREQPALIVCDVMMPGMDGFEVTRRLKNDFLTSHIPIILLTAHSSEAHQLEGIEAGADSYIIKPFSVRYLMARIKKLIKQREDLQRKFKHDPGETTYLSQFTEKDKAFIDNIHRLIEQNIENAEFSVEDFARSTGLGRTNFYKKIKGMTGYSPSEYLRIIRMKKAVELLSTTELNISEISYKVGISDPFYFSKCFKAHFGTSPSQYLLERT
jgi:signal transduction histidine kinase/ligand-binding sensor domain-containing protein/DNA-binding response OmpR family regulator